MMKKNKPFARKQVMNKEDALCKAYAAGVLAASGTMIVYGTGADRGTWGIFPNVEFRGHSSMATMEALSWFVDVHNDYHHNYSGRTHRHARFCLTHLHDEIIPFLRIFGIQGQLHDALNRAEAFDEERGLKAELKERGKIDAWEIRTFRYDLKIADAIDTVAYEVVTSIWMESDVLFGQEDASAMLSNAFNEGLRGLTLGSADLSELMAGRGILERYYARLAA